MAEEYNVQEIMSALKKKSEMDPDQHDGCYELMRETIAAYSKLKDFSTIDYRDLNLVYLTTVGTWKQGIESKKKTVEDSHLLSDDKEYLSMLWDEIWEKASNGEYSNNELDASGNGSIGLFGTGFFSFQRTTTNASARAFIWMCCDILPMTDDNAMFDRAAKVLTSRFQGMRAASASMVLHCLKPYSFPVLNSNMGRANIFEVLGVQLNKRDNIETYIENCRKIKAFRDANFTYKNYRIFDIAAWKVAEYAKKHEYGKYGYWEILSETVARLKCHGGEIVLNVANIPSEIGWFFRVSDLRTGAKQEIILAHDGFEYDGYIYRESVTPIEYQLRWDEGLSEELRGHARTSEEVMLEFTRLEDDRFEVNLIESAQSEEGTNENRVWLLTWNRRNWSWGGYETFCAYTKNGHTFTDSWACVSSKPKIGDEVFLLKLGEEPRGIVGHGKVVREQYEKEHYDPEKAERGIKHKAIDVEFDRLLDYAQEKIIPQAELTDKCSEQHWSPQGSGIEIRQEVLPALREMWEAVTKVEKYGLTRIVTFLKDYSGKHYTAPLRAGDQAEYMTEMKERGQEARQLFIDFIKDAIKDIPDLEFASCSKWINQGQIVQRYIWIELKRKEWWNYPNSVSVSVEKTEMAFGDEVGITIRSETKDIASKDEDFNRQFRLLDCELLNGMSYLLIDHDGAHHYYETDINKVRERCNNGVVRKLEVLEVVENLARNEQTILSETKKAIKEIYPLYEHVMSEDKEPEEGDWWPSLSEFDPGITAEQYKKLFTTESIVKKAWLESLYEMYKMPDQTASCKQLGNRYGYSPSHYISYFSSIGQNIQKETGISSPEDDKNAKCWPVLFQGKYLKDKSQGSYCYKMREPVKEAIEMLIKEGTFDVKDGSMVQFDHNLILYGPPGTGKTYHSVIYAVAICDGKSIEEVEKNSYGEILQRYKELKEDGRIAFTTFHQSYGYEEFIEGIKPKLDSDSDSIGYTIEDGVFKEFCKRAKNIKVQAASDPQMKAQPRIWGMILGGTGETPLKRECFEKNEIRLGWSEVSDEDAEGDFIGDSNGSWQAKHMVSDFKNTMEIGDLVVIEKSNTSIDAIGVITGEYKYDKSLGRYPRSRSVRWLAKDIDQDMVQFLPNGRKQLSRFSLFAFDYIGMDVISQILNENTIAPVLEVEQETKPYVFIIDEINRGNISKIFGELITLIEDTKRAGASEAMEATLPYSGELFSVPKNVYILGTMNTADRSIALMDTALRRRFEFAEMMPNSEVLKSLGAGMIAVGDDTLNVARMLETINKRIEYLFDREHTIGHAFFTKLAEDPSLKTLAGIFEKNVIPLLQEYFYEDYEKIQLVLGDNTKEDEFKFILDRNIKPQDIFNGNVDIDLPEKGYIIQHEAFMKLQSYKHIGKDL